MADPALLTGSAAELARRIAAGRISAVEVARACLERIEEIDGDPAAPREGDVHAFLHLTAEAALEQAAAVDRRRADGEDLPPLAGIPLALKDVFTTRGVPTTCGSRILEGYLPPYDATVVERLRQAGVVILGKTNMDEFAMGSSTENSAFGPTRNPWDLTRVPGGSSGGSAAAVAAHMAPLALGTDTGGSIRQPAALCGIVGMKPTYGQVSRRGLVAFGSSLDQAGPMARTVEDTALLHSVIGGHDPGDSTSIPQAPDPLASLRDGVEGLTVGTVTELRGEGFEPGVEQAFEQALSTLEDLGARVEEVSLPHAPYALPAYYLVNPSEASSNLARYDGVRYGLRVEAPTAEAMNAATRSAGFGAEVKRRIMIGTFALSAGYIDAYYLQASRVRTLVRRDFAEAFEGVDVLVSPTSPTVAFGLGARTEDPLAMYMSDIATVPASLAGLPALSLPCGLAPPPDADGTQADGLPVGLQIIGPVLGEATVYRVAHAFEEAAGFTTRPRGGRAVAGVDAPVADGSRA